MDTGFKVDKDEKNYIRIELSFIFKNAIGQTYQFKYIILLVVSM
jgi:hypothetical protein